jgi:hypothetical protein
MRPVQASEALKADSAEHWKKELHIMATKNNDCKKEAKDLQSRTLEEREHQTPHKQLITCSALPARQFTVCKFESSGSRTSCTPAWP